MPGAVSDYTVISELGTGSFGKCCKIKRIMDGRIFVWKEVLYGQMSEKEKEALVNEVNLLRELKHPHIVTYIDRVVERKSQILYLVMEYCAGGDLSQLIEERKVTYSSRRHLDEKFILKVFRQLISALKTLHYGREQGRILHRDLKPANVFLTKSFGDVKLGDFGLARRLHRDVSMANSYVGTPYYMSPEQVDNRQYDEASDVWSLGCLIYELCALSPPFIASNQKLLYAKIKNGSFKRIPGQYSETLFRVIKDTLQLGPKRRPTVKYLTDLPLFSQKAGIPPQSPSKLPRLLPRFPSPKPLVAGVVSPSHTSEASSGYVSDISNNNGTRENSGLQSDELQRWEKRLEKRETELNEREATLSLRENQLQEKLRLFEEAKSQPKKPELFKRLTKELGLRKKPELKLENRLVPLGQRNHKIRRSPSNPILPSQKLN